MTHMNGATFTLRECTDDDVAAADALARDYLPDASFTEARRCAPDLAWCAIDGAAPARVVGVAFGGGDNREIGLEGIAVHERWARRGIGSALLRAFEGAARARGVARISLGAAGGYVEQFYEHNGYTRVELLVSTSERAAAPAPASLAHLTIVRERAQSDGTFLFNVRSTRGYDDGERERVRRVFGARAVGLIYAKQLG